jgi:hypothetical protein
MPAPRKSPNSSRLTQNPKWRRNKDLTYFLFRIREKPPLGEGIRAMGQ